MMITGALLSNGSGGEDGEGGDEACMRMMANIL
jgi:hypothetical protein